MSRPRLLTATAVLAVLAAVVVVHAQRGPDRMRGVRESAAVQTIDDQPHVGANDLSRLLGATRYWRADVRKLELRNARHQMTLTVDNPFVTVDQRTIYLGSPVRSLKGEVHVPVALVDTLASFEGWPRLLHDTGRGTVTRVPSAGVVRGPNISHEAGITRIVFAADEPARMSITDRSRDQFELHFEGLFAGRLPAENPEESWLDTLQLVPAARGSAIEMRFDREVGSYQLVTDAAKGEIVLEVAAGSRRLSDRFASRRRPGPRDLRVIVIDPGHGGVDVGARTEDLQEKNLSLQLARLVRDQIVTRLPVEVVLTRSDDRSLSAEQRATLANRVRADVVLSLHFDAFADPGAQGMTAYYAPASDGRRRAGSTVLREWRGAGTVHAADSRQLAEAVLAGMDGGSAGPTELREMLSYPLIGVDAPGILLECGTLTSRQDRERLTSDAGMAALAALIVDGLELYQRNE